nr:hypothetical protein Iba_chr07aCG8720 [Ipomoea batatas]
MENVCLIQSDATRGAVVRPYVTTFARTSLGGNQRAVHLHIERQRLAPPKDGMNICILQIVIIGRTRMTGVDLGISFVFISPISRTWELLQEREDLLNAINAREGLNEGDGDHKEEAQTAAPHRDENETNAAGTIAFGSFRTLSLSASSYMNLSSMIAAKTQIITHSQRSE